MPVKDWNRHAPFPGREFTPLPGTSGHPCRICGQTPAAYYQEFPACWFCQTCLDHIGVLLAEAHRGPLLIDTFVAEPRVLILRREPGAAGAAQCLAAGPFTLRADPPFLLSAYVIASRHGARLALRPYGAGPDVVLPLPDEPRELRSPPAATLEDLRAAAIQRLAQDWWYARMRAGLAREAGGPPEACLPEILQRVRLVDGGT